jgi:hypothetical protein
LPVLADEHNHVIDALRYAVEQARKGIVREVKIPDLPQKAGWVIPEFNPPKEKDDEPARLPSGRRRSQWSFDR